MFSQVSVGHSVHGVGGGCLWYQVLSKGVVLWYQVLSRGGYLWYQVPSEGGYVWGGVNIGPGIRSASRRYASYWNTFLLSCAEIGSMDPNSGLCNVNMFCIVLCSHRVWNLFPSPAM